MKKTLMMLWMAVSLMVSLVGCSSEEMDYENPDVTVFVKQLKAGTYNMKLWVIESIRQGTAPSLGCRMVLANAENYEAIYFLTDDEVLDAAACYRRWWEGRKYPKTTWTIDPCYDEPLCGSGYRWW